MALRFSCDGELSETLCTSQAVDPNNEPSEMCDQIFNSITSNIADCDYFDDLHEFISLLPFTPDVIFLSESRQNQPLKNIQLQRYNFLHTKPGKKAGGVAVYLSMKFNFTQLKSFHLYGTESIWLKIWNNNSTKTILISSIYRHPTEDSNKFLDNFQIVWKSSLMKRKCFI